MQHAIPQDDIGITRGSDMNQDRCAGQAPDGSAVERYRLLPYLGELDSVRGLLSAGASVPELGCGAGKRALT